jgi:hypothetical protein
MQRKHVDDGNLTNDIGVIYHNMDSTSDFYTFRQQRYGTLEGCIQRLAQQIEAGCYDKVVRCVRGKPQLHRYRGDCSVEDSIV